jgi:heme oxygenase (mycobilin-producing)
MSIVRINVLEVPPAMAETLQERFANRAGEIDQVDGFEGFELLRPTDGSDRWFVYTRWESEEAFEAWRSSQEFQRGHAASAERGPAATGSELLAVDVALSTSRDG